MPAVACRYVHQNTPYLNSSFLSSGRRTTAAGRERIAHFYEHVMQSKPLVAVEIVERGRERQKERQRKTAPILPTRKKTSGREGA